jgi:hypothetical protein
LDSDVGDSEAERIALDRDLQAIISEFQDVWLKRNRLGGMADSVARLEKSRHAYLHD